LENGKKRLKYHIVSGFGSNPSEGKLSIYSPLGKAIVGKSINDRVIVKAPKGDTTFKILKIE